MTDNLRRFAFHITISTHTSLAGRDNRHACFAHWLQHFYSHPPHGTWLGSRVDMAPGINFYSHVPHGTWPKKIKIWFHVTNFYSHVPRGTWPSWRYSSSQIPDFYSHVPRGTWPLPPHCFSSPWWFLLTRPSRDVTMIFGFFCIAFKISTHTSLAGRDTMHFPLF